MCGCVAVCAPVCEDVASWNHAPPLAHRPERETSPETRETYVQAPLPATGAGAVQPSPQALSCVTVPPAPAVNPWGTGAPKILRKSEPAAGSPRNRPAPAAGAGAPAPSPAPPHVPARVVAVRPAGSGDSPSRGASAEGAQTPQRGGKGGRGRGGKGRSGGKGGRSGRGGKGGAQGDATTGTPKRRGGRNNRKQGKHNKAGGPGGGDDGPSGARAASGGPKNTGPRSQPGGSAPSGSGAGGGGGGGGRGRGRGRGRGGSKSRRNNRSNNNNSGGNGGGGGGGGGGGRGGGKSKRRGGGRSNVRCVGRLHCTHALHTLGRIQSPTLRDHAPGSIPSHTTSPLDAGS